MNIKKHILSFIISLSCFSIFSQNENIDAFSIGYTDTSHIPDIRTFYTSYFPENYFPDMSMYDMFFYNIFDTLAEPCKNEEAIYIFEYRLVQIKRLIDSIIILPGIISIIKNFELVTEIWSESPITSYGKYQPTDNDVRRWQKWLDENKNKLCWYKKEYILYTKENKNISMQKARWKYDRLGCLKLRNESMSETLIDGFKLESASEYRFVEIFGQPNVKTERNGDKILIYYFDSVCKDNKIIENSDYCYAEFIFRLDKLTKRNYIYPR